MDSCNLVITISAVACQVAEGMETDDLELLGAIFSQLGDTLTTISINRSSKQK